MSIRTIIALSGYMGSGKDTVAARLVEKHGYVRISLADILKEQTADKYRIPLNYFHDRDKKDAPLPGYPAILSDRNSSTLIEMVSDHLVDGHWTPRALLILEGCMARAVDTSHWVKQIMSQMGTMGERKYVITDLRFRSELHRLTEYYERELVPVRIVRQATTHATDASERDLDDCNFPIVLHNVGTLDSLYGMVDTMASVVEANQVGTLPLHLVGEEGCN